MRLKKYVGKRAKKSRLKGYVIETLRGSEVAEKRYRETVEEKHRS
ncbi:MAG: hypothetical protein QXE01_00075 [Sulfolobales archaeon]